MVKKITIGVSSFLAGWLIMGTLDNYLERRYMPQETRRVTISTRIDSIRDMAVDSIVIKQYEDKIRKYEKTINIYKELINVLAGKIMLDQKKKDIEERLEYDYELSRKACEA